jgi:hypothetical protein
VLPRACNLTSRWTNVAFVSRQSPSRDKDGLNFQEQLFVKAYIANNGNGEEAARIAGYSGDTSKRARQRLARERVWRKIQQYARAVLSPLEVKAERSLRELTYTAFADPRQLFHTDNSLLKPSLWPEAIARAIASFELNKEGVITRIRLNSKLHALQLLGLYLGMWQGAGDSRSTDRLDELVAALRKSADDPEEEEAKKATTVQ